MHLSRVLPRPAVITRMPSNEPPSDEAPAPAHAHDDPNAPPHARPPLDVGRAHGAKFAVVQRRVWYNRWRGQYALVQAPVNPRQEKSELVLDADDLVVGFTDNSGGGATSGGIGLGTAATGTLLAAGIGLSGWFGLRASLLQIRDSYTISRRLRRERQEIVERVPVEAWTGHNKDLWEVKRVRTARAMLANNHVDEWEQRTRAVFAGAVTAIASGTEIVGYLGQPALFGSMSPALLALSPLMLTISVPFITAFAAANSVMETARFVRATRDKKLVPQVVKHNPWGSSFDAGRHIHSRLKLLRWQSGAEAIGFGAITAGVPLTFWGGPFGMAVLAPGIIAVAVASHWERHKVIYQNPLSMEQIQWMVTVRQIVNAMGFAHLDYRTIKTLKHSKRAQYPYGGEAPRVWRWLMRPVQKGMAHIKPKPDSHEPAEQTLYRYMLVRHALEDRYWRQELVVLHDVADRNREEGLDWRIKVTEAKLEEATIEQKQVQEEWARFATLPVDVSVARVCTFMRDHGLFPEFGLRLVRDKITRRGLGLKFEPHAKVTPEFVEAAAARATGRAEPWIPRFFKIAEEVLFTTYKTWRRSRAWELADIALRRRRVVTKVGSEKTLPHEVKRHIQHRHHHRLRGNNPATA